ncbi:hypothetical protein [uncultured Citricoccus sp.]|uniref:hypothetical protein n=1 Tax=uncultured Citricoccus sp. TaxID=614031 RepID=UPI00262168D3|nr:hypothetical protein [uncultured Citricoccus sp.]
MMSIMVAALMWGLVLVLALRAKHRPDNTLMWAATVIAISMTTNVPGIYLWSATWLPPNALDLMANLLLVIGVYYLASAIRRGATAAGMAGGVEANWTRIAAVVTILVMGAAFMRIDAPEPSTNFMLTYGSQPAAGLYSAVQYVFIFGVMLGTLTTCIRNVPRMIQARFKVGFSVTGAGCMAALLLCVSVVAMDICHVVGELEFMRVLGGIYDVLFFTTMILLCVGLAIPPLSRQINSLQLRRRVLAVEPEVRRIWSSTVATTPSVSLVGARLQRAPAAQKLRTDQATDGMHRMLVEIHDYLNVTASSDILTAADWRCLDEAEALCLQQGRALDG